MMPKVGDRVIVQLPDDDEVETRVEAVAGDQVEIAWPTPSDRWVASRGMMSRNADGSWNTMIPVRSDDVHPRGGGRA